MSSASRHEHATGRTKGNQTQQLLAAIDSLCSDPAWIVITEHIGADAVILVKLRRLQSLCNRLRVEAKP